MTGLIHGCPLRRAGGLCVGSTQGEARRAFGYDDLNDRSALDHLGPADDAHVSASLSADDAHKQQVRQNHGHRRGAELALFIEIRNNPREAGFI
jgi:hypothetical protein